MQESSGFYERRSQLKSQMEDMLDERGPFLPVNELQEILAAATAEEQRAPLWHYARGVYAARTGLQGADE